MIGRVISTKTKDTATVLVTRVAMHRFYKKTFIRSKKYLVHDLLGVKEGDMVEIVNRKKESKKKSWKIVRLVGKNLSEIAEAKLKQQAAAVIAEVLPEDKMENSDEKNIDQPNTPAAESSVKKAVKKRSKKNGTTQN